MSQRKRKKKAVATQLFERVERNLAKGNAKLALKEAEIGYRQDPSHNHRQLLERAYLARVEQLQAMKLAAEARSVLARLTELGPTLPEIVGKLPRLRVILGDARADSAALLEKDPALLAEVADRAVLDPAVVPPDVAGLKAHVRHVRDALAAIERGDDDGAAECLLAIPRKSPLGDWKLFLRGLSAFYQGDRERTEENWRRLDPARPAWRIAQTLRVAAGDLRLEDSPLDVAGPVRRLQAHMQQGPVSVALGRLAEHWRSGDLDEFFREYRRFRQRYGQSHREVIDKIVDRTWKRAVRDGEARILTQLFEIGPAPALDPHWNRAKAMLAEHPRCDDAGIVERYWTRYADDVASLACLREDERAIAAGLVYLHLARNFVGYGQGLKEDRFVSRAMRRESHALQKDAARFFRESILRCPRLVDAYRELAALHAAMEEPAKSAAVFRRLLQELPEDYDAHLWLANHHLGRDEPDKSEPHVEAVFRIKPRDPRTVSLRWNQRVTMIRCLTKRRMFEAARREWQEAARSPAPDVEPYTLDTLRAGIEFKANATETAQQFLDAAIAKAGDATAVWMQMSFTAARFGLARHIKKDFDDRFKKAIKANPTSPTAGRLARLLLMLKGGQINYTGRATQENLFIGYLKRAKRVGWNEGDLLDVCRYLRSLSKEVRLRKDTIAAASRRFPDNPHFHLWLGNLAMAPGPFTCNHGTAIYHMQRALELAGRAKSAGTQEVIEEAREALSLLRDHQERMWCGPAFLGGDDEDDDEYEDEYEDEEDDDEYDDDDEEDGFFFGSPFGAYGDGDDRPGPPHPRPSAEQLYAEMERIMPRPILEQMKRTAAETGVSLVDLIREFLEQEGRGRPTGPSGPRGRRDKNNRRARR